MEYLISASFPPPHVCITICTPHCWFSLSAQKTCAIQQAHVRINLYTRKSISFFGVIVHMSSKRYPIGAGRVTQHANTHTLHTHTHIHTHTHKHTHTHTTHTQSTHNTHTKHRQDLLCSVHPRWPRVCVKNPYPRPASPAGQAAGRGEHHWNDLPCQFSKCSQMLIYTHLKLFKMTERARPRHIFEFSRPARDIFFPATTQESFLMYVCICVFLTEENCIEEAGLIMYLFTRFLPAFSMHTDFFLLILF